MQACEQRLREEAIKVSGGEGRVESNKPQQTSKARVQSSECECSARIKGVRILSECPKGRGWEKVAPMGEDVKTNKATRRSMKAVKDVE